MILIYCNIKVNIAKINFNTAKLVIFSTTDITYSDEAFGS